MMDPISLISTGFAFFVVAALFAVAGFGLIRSAFAR